MAYPQDAGLSSLMANYGNISQGMNPGQQPSFGGNPYFPGMFSMSPTPSYQPQDFGGFAPSQLTAQNAYGTQDGIVNYGYGQQPVVDYAKQLADQQAKAAADQAAADELAKAKAAQAAQGAQNVYAPNPMTGGQASGRYDARLDGSPAPAMSPVETSVWARAHPFLAIPGQFLSSLGMMVGQPGAEAYNNAFRGYTLTNPAVEDKPALHPESDGGVGDTRQGVIGVNGYGSESAAGGDGGRASDAVGGYYANGQFNQPTGYAYGGITSLLR